LCVCVCDLVLAADSFPELLRNLSLESLKKLVHQGEFWENRFVEVVLHIRTYVGFCPCFMKLMRELGEFYT